ncbi:Ubiquitin-conjugating enzyme E2 T [Chamberlinius hualienensis]
MQRSARMSKEIAMLQTSPPPGISCWSNHDQLDELEASIIGGEDTPYYGGIFKLSVNIPTRYPFEPPTVRFITPIYHPNIDENGRICLDILKMPPAGNWKPCLNVSSVLTSIQLLMASPNPDDPLVEDVAQEYVFNRELFFKKARESTEKYAKK